MNRIGTSGAEGIGSLWEHWLLRYESLSQTLVYPAQAASICSDSDLKGRRLPGLVGAWFG